MDSIIHKAGEEAARHGVPLSGCPYLKAANMPGHTGESPTAWQAKVTSWEDGWRKETAARLAALRRRQQQLLSD